MSKDQEFEEFAVLRTPHLYRTAWLLCGDAHRAEDLVQDTLAKVYVRWTRKLGRRLENPAGYAHTALVHTWIDHQRRRSSHERPVGELPEQGTPDGDPSLRLSLAAALDALDPMDRAVLVLRYLDDVSVAEVADRLGVSPGAVRNRSMRALSRIRDVLGTSLPDLLIP